MKTNCATRIAAPLGLAAMLLALAGCGRNGLLGAVGLVIPPPDEFQVVVHKPLDVPATASLPEPHPGAPSPLDPTPHRDAVEALLGAGASQAVADVPPSAGEQVLLSSADAGASSPEVRVQLEADKIKEESSKPYEAPTVGELIGLGGSKEKVDEKQVIDPVAESTRLQKEGVVTPVDPNAELPDELKPKQ